MQFLCELFIGDAFKLFIVHLLFTFYPSKLAVSVSVLHSQRSAALGQSAWDLIGDRCTQSALASPFQITCHSACSLKEVGGVRLGCYLSSLRATCQNLSHPFLLLL